MSRTKLATLIAVWIGSSLAATAALIAVSKSLAGAP